MSDASTQALATVKVLKAFEKDLAKLINGHSLENLSNTPDYILAQHLVRCLEDFALTANAREEWYGRVNEHAEI